MRDLHDLHVIAALESHHATIINFVGTAGHPVKPVQGLGFGAQTDSTAWRLGCEGLSRNQQKRGSTPYTKENTTHCARHGHSVIRGTRAKGINPWGVLSAACSACSWL
jgi:hypothetical protein